MLHITAKIIFIQMKKKSDLLAQIKLLEEENKELREKCVELESNFQVDSSMLKDDFTFSKSVLAVFDIMPQPITITSVSLGEFIYCNKAFETLSGYSFKKIKGKTTLDLKLYSKKRRKRFINIIKEQGLIEKEPITFRHNENTINHTLMYSKLIKPNNNYILSVIVDITELQNIKRAFKESEKFYKSIANNSPDALFIINKKGKIKFVNEQHYKISGRAIDETVGHYFFEFIPRMYRPAYLRALKNGFINKEITRFESYIYHKNGGIIPVEISGKIVKYKGKTVVFGNVRDISERLKNEKALFESNEKYRLVTQQIIDTIFMVDREGFFLFLNKTQINLLGWDIDDMIGQNFTKIVPEELKGVFQEKLQDVFNGNEVDFESNIYHKNGNIIPIEIKATRTIYNGKNVALGVLREISERKKDELEKEMLYYETTKTKNFLRKVIDSTDNLVFAKDKDNKYIFANKAYCDVFNLSISEIKNKTDDDLKKMINYKSNYTNIFSLQKIGDTLKERPEYLSSYNHVLMPDNSEKVFSCNKVNIRKDNEDLDASLFYATDITKMMRTERELTKLTLNLEKIVAEKTQKLLASEDNFKKMFEKSSEFKFIFSPNGNILQVNDTAAEIIKMPKDEILKQNISKFWNAEFINDNEKVSFNSVNEYASTFETTLFSSNQATIPVEVSIVAVDYFCENAILATGRDISVRKEMQKKVLKAIIETEEKERNRFAQEVHDGLGAFLSSIKMYIDLMIGGQIPKEKIEEYLVKTKHIINEAAESAREISNDIKPHILTNLGLKKSIVNIIEKITGSTKIKTDIFIQTNNIVLNDEFSLTIYRIVTEMLNNAIKHANAEELKLFMLINKTSLILEYEDNGKGFELSEVLKRNKGNGLVNIRNRVESVNGKTDINSELGKGTKITITINIEDFINEDY